MHTQAMNTYKRYRFPSEIIQYAVWLYHRFNLSHRDVEDLQAERGITVSYEAIRLWCNKFGAEYATRLKRKCRGFGDTFFIDVFLQERRDSQAAKRFFKRLIRSNQGEPRKIVKDFLVRMLKFITYLILDVIISRLRTTECSEIVLLPYQIDKSKPNVLVCNTLSEVNYAKKYKCNIGWAFCWFC